MSETVKKILVIQTAFIGDVILTLPLVQVLKKNFPEASIDVVATPQAAQLFANHPAVTRIIPYDKRGSDSNLGGFLRIRKKVQSGGYELAIVPHRSLRSALLAVLSGIPSRIGFDKSAGRLFFTRTVHYQPNIHEIERNLSLLAPLNIGTKEHELPALYPCDKERESIDRLMDDEKLDRHVPLVALAPGTIWNTKRWPRERFAEVSRRLRAKGYSVALVGSDADRALCEEIIGGADDQGIVNAAGRLSLLESAELIRRARVIVTNDSAPMHIAVAVRTPVIAVFGATVPAFGFSPYGQEDVVVETNGLSCRPCSIHGSHSCPIKSFDCMIRIEPDRVLNLVQNKIDHVPPQQE